MRKKLLPEKKRLPPLLLYFLVIFIVCSTHVSDDLPYISCYPPSPNILPQLQKMRRSVPWKNYYFPDNLYFDESIM